MAKSIHVRLDRPSEEALRLIRMQGMSESEAVRSALKEAAERRRQRNALKAEVARVASDEADRAEMRLIREQMEELSPQQD